MKKVMFLLAVAGMFAFASCNNAAEAPATEEAPQLKLLLKKLLLKKLLLIQLLQ